MQATEGYTEKYTHTIKEIFVSWGGNRESYSKSDITFKGKDYNFTDQQQLKTNQRLAY
jgi:hypothetical protein